MMSFGVVVGVVAVVVAVVVTVVVAVLFVVVRGNFGRIYYCCFHKCIK